MKTNKKRLLTIFSYFIIEIETGFIRENTKMGWDAPGLLQKMVEGLSISQTVGRTIIGLKTSD